MPHFHIDYSANLEPDVDFAALCEVIRASAVETGVFPTPGIRVRAVRVDHYAMADGQDTHGYVDLSIRLNAERSDEVRAAVLAHIYSAFEAFMAPALRTRSIALSAEVRGIPEAFSARSGTIRDHM